MSDYISAGFNSKIISVNHIRNALLVGFGLFLISLPLYRSKKSFFDAAAAKKVLLSVRFISVIETFWIAPLLYCVISLGSPILINPYTPYGNGNSWIYGFGRPSMGIVLINFGMIAGMHHVPRIMCITGCLLEIIFDSVSAFQVMSYIDLMNNNSAPNPGKYTIDLLRYYYYRDISSIAICTYLLMMTLFATLIMGCTTSQLISYQLLDGEDLDRCHIMNQQSKLRQYLDECDNLGDQVITDKATRKRQRKEIRRLQREEEKNYLLSVNAGDLAEMQLATNSFRDTEMGPMKSI